MTMPAGNFAALEGREESDKEENYILHIKKKVTRF
uniref:Uncharacterized protein n=1 Tax=Rhizophora mucronata TaxID=61149 RepID=A0A2P2QA77_RHIMU